MQLLFYWLLGFFLKTWLLKTEPPLYDITQATLPTALFWAENDWLADPYDVQYIRNRLPNIVYDQFIEDWDHLDFIW